MTAPETADHIVDADHMVETVNVPRGVICRVLALSNPSRPAAGAMDRMAEIYGIAREAHRPPLPESSGNPGGLREKVAEAINRAMIDGQGDQDIIHLATDDILAIPEIAALQGAEVNRAAEIVDEWLAMVGTFTPENLSRVRHVPACQSEVEAIREILAALRGEG